MARTTRSAATHDKPAMEKETLNDVVSLKNAKATSKKRKRVSGADSDSAPTAKHPRSDDEMEDDEEAHVKEENGIGATFPPFAGELSLREEDARKILDVLEMSDTQGLLDRVFHLQDERPGSSSPSPSPGSKPPSASASLRAMLKEPNEHPLRVLRSAVDQLIPISSQPRSRPSQPAEHQMRFCKLALSLIDQASGSTTDVLSLNSELVFPERSPEVASTSSGLKAGPAVEKRRKYALMQTLPTGEWWTSLNSDMTGSDGTPVKGLSTANADLVSILPAPAASSPGALPTLGDLTLAKKSTGVAKPLPVPTRMKAGHFLDYGPYASFAPKFDSEGAGVGRIGLTDVLWRRIEKGKAREKAKVLRERMQRKISSTMEIDIEEHEEVSDVGNAAEQYEKEKRKQNEILSSILGTDGSDGFMGIMDQLELEEGISELLAKNSKLLLRLETLQAQRLGGEKGGSSVVKVGSEEWDMAQKLMDSFSLLVTMRPRLTSKSSSAIIPPPSLLRALHRTLPSQPTQGWYGTLSEGRGSALRGDSTIFMQTPVPVPAQAPVTTAPVVPTPAPAVTATGATYSSQPSYGQQNFPYPSYTQGYRPPYASFPGQGQQPISYYPTANYPNSATTSHPQPSGTAPAPYGANQSQSPYTWQTNYQQQLAMNAGAPGTTSGRGTPQPIVSGMPAPYAAYNPPAGLATPARAVANTIASLRQPNGWSTPGAAYASPTLPPHMRTAAASPANPGSPLAGYGQGYGTTPTYQHAPSAAT